MKYKRKKFCKLLNKLIVPRGKSIAAPKILLNISNIGISKMFLISERGNFVLFLINYITFLLKDLMKRGKIRMFNLSERISRVSRQNSIGIQ